MFIIKAIPLWAPADEGAPAADPNGVGGVAAPQPGDGAARAEGGAPPPGEQGELGAKPAGSSILDYAPKGAAPKPGEQGEAWKLPDGLEVPAHLLGSSAEDTLKKLSTAYKGARQELSTRKREDGVLEGEVPKDIDGYTFEGDLEKDPILKDLASEESKPIVDAWRKAALECGIPNAAFAKFMHAGITKMQEGGVVLNLNSDEAAKINGEAELEALEKELGKAGAEENLRQLDTFAQKLAEKGILRDKADVSEYGQMVGTARAAQIMQRIIAVEFGERAIPPADPLAGAPTLEEAYEAQRMALAMPHSGDREGAVKRSEEMIARAMRESSTPGQVRSRVL